MDQHGSVGQPLLELVVVGDDQLQAQPPGLLGLAQAGDAAIDGDDHRRPRLGDLPQRLGVEAVPLLQAVRHVEIGRRRRAAAGPAAGWRCR